jgi:hypothetical protein
MKWSSHFLVGIFLTGMLLCAGCTQSAGTPGTDATPAGSVPVLPLSALALTAADAPANYTLTESRVKAPGEVGSLAKELGWQDGYIVTFSSTPGTGEGPTEIVQNLVTYPASTIPSIVRISKTNEMNDQGLTTTLLPSPGLGNSSYAFSGTPSGMAAADQNNNPLVQVSGSVPARQDMAEIIFSKGSTMEVLRMNGPGANYSVIRELAETAYARLP